MLDLIITVSLAILASLQALLLDLMAPIDPKRGTRGRGGRGGEAKRIKLAMYRQDQATHTGDDLVAHQGPSGIRGHVWTAWVGYLSMPRNEGRREAVNCSLVDLPAGQFGTQTPVSKAYVKTVAAGLA